MRPDASRSAEPAPPAALAPRAPLWLLAGLLLATGAGALAAPQTASQPRGGAQAPRRLILCIGDGMGWGALSVAALEVDGSTLLSGAGAVGAVDTGSYDFKVTDSAAAATAFATGRRTRNGWLGLDPQTRVPLPTIAEEAWRRGLAVGLVTTTTIVHATPAGFYAHVDDRDRYEEIALQLSRFHFDFAAGGGRKYFLPKESGGARSDGQNLISALEVSGVKVATTLDEARSAPAGRPLALLYSDGDPPAAGPDRPALRDLVDLALQRLSRDPDGFFLMVEGGQIDWAEHDRNARQLVAELADFGPAVARAREFAGARPHTAVVVVADHDTGGPALVQEGKPDAPLEIRFLVGDHTALLVPLLLNGPPAQAWARLRHQTDLASAMWKWLLGSER